MRLYLCISIALSLFGATLSSPLDDYFRRTYKTAYDNYAGAQYFQPYRADASMQGYKYPTELGAQYYFTDRQGGNMPELDSTLVEINERTNNAEYSNEVEEQASPLKTLDVHYGFIDLNIVNHGAKIALQSLYQKLTWLGCAGNSGLCGKAVCPRLYMEGEDWNSCWGEVFQIYRAGGPDSVKVGDHVGFYAVHDRAWLSMVNGRARKAGCPGTPTTNYGFAAQDKWDQCWGEVFQIYAKGKSIGDTIKNHDDITIYYIQDKKWVAFVGDVPALGTCPGETRPPPPDDYDKCSEEIFELWLHKD